MRPFFFLLLIAVLNLSANAKCASSGIWCWPASNTINSNGIIMVEFFGYSQNIAGGLNTRYPIYLKAGDEKIKLTVTEMLPGEFQVTQIIAKPEKELRVGLTYELVIDGLPKEYGGITKWDNETQKAIPYSWTATVTKDLLSPSWNAQPVYVSKSYTAFGCGPAQSVNYRLAVNDASEVLVKTTVTNIATGKSSSYYLVPTEGKLTIGHGMCSGAFAFRDGKEFEAVFSLLDASGNTTCENTPAYRFTAPAERDGFQTGG